jgi:1,4-alpha-glucan branching enzyme
MRWKAACPCYNGGDFFSPDLPYVERDQAVLNAHLATINRLLAAKGFSPLLPADIASAPAQLKVLVDLSHLYGIAVVFDVVYNHAGGFFGDDHSIYFWDRANNGDNNQSLYCTDKGWAGGLAFALWNQDVRQFLINNASSFLKEFHADGFRYDEISVLLSIGGAIRVPAFAATSPGLSASIARAVCKTPSIGRLRRIS